MISITIYIFLYFSLFLIVGVKSKWQLTLSFCISTILLSFSFLSLYYYSISNNIFRDYSNLQISPFIYLFVCNLITLIPIFLYETKGSNLLVSNSSWNLIKYTSLFLILCSILPFIENIIHLPQIFTNTDSLSKMYDNRLNGENNEFLSFIGRKFHRICTDFNLLIPIFLFLWLLKKPKKTLIIIGLIIAILNLWLHSMALGGRSKLVQNILYTLGVYCVMFRFFDDKTKHKINTFLFILIGLGVFFVLLVSVSRFTNMDNTQLNNVWEWLALYAGEGPLNFNSLMWHVNSSLNGIKTLILPLYLFNIIPDYSVEFIWNKTASLGIPGNIFYTYVGTIYSDYSALGTIIFLSLISFIISLLLKKRKSNLLLSHIILVSLVTKILVVPTFYTYTTYDSQIALCIALIFCLCSHLRIKRN